MRENHTHHFFSKRGIIRIISEVTQLFGSLLHISIPTEIEVQHFYDKSMKDFRGGFSMTSASKSNQGSISTADDFSLSSNEFWHWTQEIKDVSSFLEWTERHTIYNKVGLE